MGCVQLADLIIAHELSLLQVEVGSETYILNEAYGNVKMFLSNDSKSQGYFPMLTKRNICHLQWEKIPSVKYIGRCAWGLVGEG